MAGQTVQVSVLADTRDFTRKLRGLGSEAEPALGRLRGLASGVGAILGGLGIAAGAGMAVGVGRAIASASQLEQSIGGLEAVFGAQAETMHRFARDAATTAGLSRNAYNELATSIGTTLKNAGTPMGELGGRTNELLTLSADLAATFGGPVTQSAGAMASALRGEYEPLRAYGVSLSAAEVQARALADTGKTNAAQLTAQEKALATQALILDQTTDAQGAFARESRTLAGILERLRAIGANLATGLATRLLPGLTAVAGAALGLLEDTDGLRASLERWRVPILAVAGVIAAVFLPHLIALGVQHTVTAAKAVAAWATQQAAAIAGAAAHSLAVVRTVAGWALMATQALISAARMAAAWLIALGPIGLVIAAVVGLAALIIANWDKITAWTKAAWTTVSAWLSNTWASIKATATRAWDGVLAFFRGIPGKLVQIFLNFTLPGLLIKHWDSIRTGATAAWSAVVEYVRGIPGRLLGALGNLGGLLLGAGGKLISGLLEGIQGGFQRVRDTLGRLTSLLPDWKGPASRDLGLLRRPGQLVIEGFVRSLRSRFPNVRRTLGQLSDLVAGTELPMLGAPGLGAGTPAIAAGALPGARVYTVNVQALAATPEVGRVVVAAIRDFERVNGPGR
jgi:hypothetical protein